MELPDCIYDGEAVMIPPCAPTPKHSLYLSNLDDQKFLRFSVKYFYLFKKSVSFHILRRSLSRVLVNYYPFAGRLRRSSASLDDDDDDHKLELDCNGEGAVFAQAFMDTTAQQLLQPCKVPDKRWRKFLYVLQVQSFLDVPPLVVQVTSLRCGGMILCAAFNHCVCDGTGMSQFLHAWAQLARNLDSDLTIVPFHTRHVLRRREPPEVTFRHAGYTSSKPEAEVDLFKLLVQSQPLVPTSFTFTHSHVLRLKNRCVPSLKCTTFEAVAAHTWRSWIRSVSPPLPAALVVKLLFSVNIRAALKLPSGFYGNGFVLACAESTVTELVEGENKLQHAVRLVQEAKARAREEEYVRSMVDLLENKTVKTDLSTSLLVSEWSKLGLEEVDFGEGKALHMGPLTSDFYCLFLPVTASDGHDNALRALLSLPDSMLQRFHCYMKEDHLSSRKNNNGYHQNGFLSDATT